MRTVLRVRHEASHLCASTANGPFADPGDHSTGGAVVVRGRDFVAHYTGAGYGCAGGEISAYRGLGDAGICGV